MKAVSLLVLLFIADVTASFADQNTPRITESEYRLYIRTSPEYKIAERELHSVYNELLKVLSFEERKNLMRSQRKWIKYREEKAFRTAPKGSETYINALVKITNERTNELKVLLENSKSSHIEKYATITGQSSNGEYDFTDVFNDKPVGYIDVWKPTKKEKIKILKQIGMCKSIKRGVDKEILCIGKVNSQNCDMLINQVHVARGNFTGYGYQEVVLDVRYMCPDSMYPDESVILIRNGKLLAELPPFLDIIRGGLVFFGSVKTQSNKTKILVSREYDTAAYSITRDVRLCEVVKKSPKEFEHECEELLLGRARPLYKENRWYNFLIEGPKIVDVNSDSIGDILFEMNMKVYKINGKETLIYEKPFHVEFVFNGEKFEPTPRTVKNLEKWNKLVDRVDKKWLRGE